MNAAVMTVLEDGGSIHYAPVSGGMILLTHEGEQAPVQPSMLDFIDAKSDGIITKTGEMGQGHNIFHGRVLFYKLATPEN